MEDRWYVINVVSGKDVKAKQLLEFDLKISGLDRYVKEIVIPIEKYKTIVKKKTVIKERNTLTGYMLICVSEMHPEIINTVNKTNFVIGFLGQSRKSRKNPFPITAKEADRMLLRHNEEPKAIEFSVGDTVKVTEGAFKSFSGNILSINEDTNKATIDIKVFSRSTKVEMNVTDFQKEY